MSGHNKEAVKIRNNNYIAAGNSNAKSYWDRPLRMGEVAAILKVRTSVLKEAIMSGKTELDGKRLPEVDAITDIEICFKGRSVEEVMPDWISMPRSKKTAL